jgi:hypothetical protein
MPAINYQPTRIDPAIDRIMAPQANAYELATAGMRGVADADARFEKEQAAKEAQEKAAYKAMLDDPDNAEYHAKTHGIPYTPALQQMLKQPKMLKNVMVAQEYAKGMGITNPTAAQKMMMKAAEMGAQGIDFNPLEVMGAPGSTPMIKPPQPKYAGGGSGSRKVEKAVKPWEDVNVPPELRIEGQMLDAKVRSGAMAVDKNIAAEVADYQSRVAPFMTGGNRQPVTPPASAPRAGVQPRTATPPPAKPLKWGDLIE